MSKQNEFELKYDIGGLAGYELRLIEPTNTYLYSALEYSQSFYNFTTYYFFDAPDGFKNIESTDNFDFGRHRFSLHFGIRQRINLLNDKLVLGIGIGAVKRFYPDKEVNTSGDSFRYNETTYLRFEYSVTTYHDGLYKKDGFISNHKIVNFDSDIFVSWKLKDGINLKWGLMYNRSHYVFYRYRLDFSNVMLDDIVPFWSVHDGNLGANGSLDYIRNDIFYTNIGLYIDPIRIFGKSSHEVK